jgi:hypothetical protein
LLDTIELLRGMGIQTIGGGRNLAEARQPADSDDVARSFRDHVARCSDMMSPA